MKSSPLLFALGFLLHSGLAAAEIRPFVSGSLAKIQAERNGKAFILALWSENCTHCPSELKALGELVKRHPGLDIVLVSADTPDKIPLLENIAKNYGLSQQAQWVFAEPQAEKLRFEIDRRWYGELPRSYFYDTRHRRQASSGVIPAERLEQWANEQVK